MEDIRTGGAKAMVGKTMPVTFKNILDKPGKIIHYIKPQPLSPWHLIVYAAKRGVIIRRFQPPSVMAALRKSTVVIVDS